MPFSQNQLTLWEVGRRQIIELFPAIRQNIDILIFNISRAGISGHYAPCVPAPDNYIQNFQSQNIGALRVLYSRSRRRSLACLWPTDLVVLYNLCFQTYGSNFNCLVWCTVKWSGWEWFWYCISVIRNSTVTKSQSCGKKHQEIIHTQTHSVAVFV